jgi:hypothetical protein
MAYCEGLCCSIRHIRLPFHRTSVHPWLIVKVCVAQSLVFCVLQVDRADYVYPSTEPQFIHDLLWGFVLLNQTQQITLPQNLSSSMAYCEGLCCSIIRFLCVTSRQSRLPFHRTSVHPWLIVMVYVPQSLVFCDV